MREETEEVASVYASSITLGVGQFCTNPGLIIALDGPELQTFMRSLSDKIKMIQPGDMLTTSGTPGHAMKAIDRERAFGAVIGKAMTGLSEGKGLVLVLVNLQ